jgi:hypothetical protein
MTFYSTLKNDLAALISGEFSATVTLTLNGISQVVYGIFDQEYLYFNPETRAQVLAEEPRLTLFTENLVVDANNNATVFNIRGIDYLAHHWDDNADGTVSFFLTKVT